MRARKIVMGTAICLVVGLLASLAFSQPGGGAGQGQGGKGKAAQGGQGGQGGGRGSFDPAQMSDRMKQQMGATDEEWKVLGPKVMKVMELSRQASGRGGMFGGRGGGKGGAQADPARVQSELEKAVEALQQVVDNQSSTPAQIKEKLTALRAAREKAKQELAKAQQDLKAALSVKQEAVLVLAGSLD